MAETQKNILQAYAGKSTQTPWWMMRQAGRYLPEYRELRKEAGGFLDLVYNSEMASEITLQPIRRYGMDGAILFSDILVIPQALGQPLRFEAGEGPKLDPVYCADDIKKLDLDRIDFVLSPIYETVKKVRQKLFAEGFEKTALIGFCGGPWTVACYMVEGGGSKDFSAVKSWAARDPKSFHKLLDYVVEASIHYLTKQIEAGAEAIQIFESWAGLLDEQMFKSYVIDPTARIIDGVRKIYPQIPVVGFPRGAGYLIETYADQLDVNCVALDFMVPLECGVRIQKTGKCIQGNLDPARLLAGGTALETQTLKILDAFSGGPFVFNLGHGVIKETDPAHVSDLAQLIKSYK